MKKIYNIPLSQLIVIIVFGFIGELVVLISTSDCYDGCWILGFLAVLIPFIIIFYIVGWVHYDKKNNPKGLKKEKTIGFKKCENCSQFNIPTSTFCLNCGNKL